MEWQVAGCRLQVASGKLQVLTNGGWDRVAWWTGDRVTGVDFVTAEARRAELARQHSEAQARRGGRSIREQARLRMLQWRARHYARGSVASGGPPQRILVIRPDHLGDLLFTTPALHYLRSQYPQAHIAALIGPWGEAVLAGNSDVDEILTLPFPGFTREPKGGALAPYALLQEEAQRLAAGRFDLALILRFDHWWGAWLAAAAGIPRRIGYDIDEVRPFVTQAEPHLPRPARGGAEYRAGDGSSRSRCEEFRQGGSAGG